MNTIINQVSNLIYPNYRDLYVDIKNLISNRQLFNFIRPKNYEIITKKLESEIDANEVYQEKEYNFNFDEWIKQIYEDDVNIVQRQIELIMSKTYHLTANKIHWYMFYDPRYFQCLLNNMRMTYQYIRDNGDMTEAFMKIINFYHLIEIYTNKYTFIEWKYHHKLSNFRVKSYKDPHNIDAIVNALDWNKVVLVGSACQRLYFKNGKYNDIDLINKTDNLDDCAMSCFISISRNIMRSYVIIYRTDYKIIAKFNKTEDAPELTIEVFNVNNLEEKVSNFHFDPARMYYDGKFHMTIGCFKALRTGIIYGAKYFTGKKKLTDIFENYSKKGYRFVLPINDRIRTAFYIKKIVLFDPQGCDFDKVKLNKIKNS